MFGGAKSGTDAIISGAAKGLGFGDKQNAYNMLMDLWAGVTKYATDLFRSGIGVMFPGVGAFVFRNSVDKDGKVRRTPGFIFADTIVQRGALKVKHREQACVEGHSKLGSIYEVYAPVRTLSWPAIATRSGLTTPECNTGYKIVVEQLENTISAHSPVKFSLGCGTLMVQSGWCEVILDREVIASIPVGTLTKVVTSGFTSKPV